MCFGMEFIALDAEKKAQKLTLNISNKMANNQITSFIYDRFCQLIRMEIIYFALIAFEVKTFSKSVQIWNSLYWFLPVSWLFLLFIDKFYSQKAKSQKRE